MWPFNARVILPYESPCKWCGMNMPCSFKGHIDSKCYQCGDVAITQDYPLERLICAKCSRIKPFGIINSPIYRRLSFLWNHGVQKLGLKEYIRLREIFIRELDLDAKQVAARQKRKEAKMITELKRLR